MRISVITAVYNNCATIAAAIESVLAQAHGDVELIVIDGASTDGTREILERYRDRIAIFVSEPDGGIYDALNKGIRYASGDIVGFLHSDDLFADEHVLSRIASTFDAHDVDAIYGDLIYVRRDDPDMVVRYWRSGSFSRRKLRLGWMPPHPTLYLRRSVYERLGGFDTSYRISADYESVLRYLGKASVKCEHIPEVLVKMRVGGASNRSLGNVVRKMREDFRALKYNQVGGSATLLMKSLSKLPQFFTRPAKAPYTLQRVNK